MKSTSGRNNYRLSSRAFALLLIIANYPLYKLLGIQIVQGSDLVTFTYFIVIALTTVIIIGFELRKWLALEDNDPFYEPTLSTTRRKGNLVGEIVSTR